MARRLILPVAAIALLAFVAAALAASGRGSGAFAWPVLALGCLGPIAALGGGTANLWKSLWLALALSPLLAAAVHVASRLAVGTSEVDLPLANAVALAVLGAVALAGLRARVTTDGPGRAVVLGFVFAAVLGAIAGADAAPLELDGAEARAADPAGPRLPDLERVALLGAARRGLPPTSPFEAGAGLPGLEAVHVARAAWCELGGLGPRAEAAAEASVFLFVLALAGAYLAAAVGRRGAGSLAGALVAGLAPFVLGVDPGVLAGTSAAFVGLVASWHGAGTGAEGEGRGPLGWRLVAAFSLGCALLLAPAAGSAGLVVAVLAAIAGPAAVDRILPLLVAAVPGAWNLAEELAETEATGPPAPVFGVRLAAAFVLVAAACALLVPRERRARALVLVFVVAAAISGAALAATLPESHGHAVFALDATFGAVLLAAALGAGTEKRAATLDVRRVASALALVALVGACVVAAHPRLDAAIERARRPSALVDVGPGRVAPIEDSAERIAQAFAGAPPETVYDPRWKEPRDVESPDGPERADVLRFLAEDGRVRRADPVVVVDPTATTPRYGRGVELRDARLPHEVSAIAQLDVYVDRIRAGSAPPTPEHAERTAAVSALLRDDQFLTPVMRRGFTSLGRPVVLVVGARERRLSHRVRVDRAPEELGFVRARSFGDTVLYAWPAEFAAELSQDAP
ncbi:MAG: hypothetical protein R3F34_11985 [Planctomycetota bacterium]